MSNYQPVPVIAAKGIADAYAKPIVAIVSWDPEHKRVHTTTYGVTAVDKLSAAALGELLATAAGADLTQKESYEDFRTVDAAERARRIEVLQAFVMDWIAEWDSTLVDPEDTNHEWAELYQRAKELVARDSMPTREADHGT